MMKMSRDGRATSPLLLLSGLLAALFLQSSARGDDWPTYRHDWLRTGVSKETLAPPLVNVWTFHAHGSDLAPKDMVASCDRSQPVAMYDKAEYFELLPDQTRFALPITAAGDSLFFTTATGRVVCLDAATAKVRWQFLAGGAITQTANIADGKVYIGSDDGYAYCLDAKTGALLWKHQSVPADRWFLSFGRMSSRWPVRTDVVVDDGGAYFCAGAFPHDGMYVNKVDARTGSPIWQTTYSGSGLSGWMLATKTTLFPRIDAKGFNRSPFFRRADGFCDPWGGDPELKELFDGRFADCERGVVIDGVRYTAFDAWRNREPDPKKQKIYSVPPPKDRWPDTRTFIYAGGTLYFLANDSGQWGAAIPGKFGGAVFARDPKTGNELWSFPIPERPYQIILANGRLFVSTRSGTIYCFAPKGAAERGKVKEDGRPPDPFKQDPALDAAKETVARAKKVTGLNDGYVVVLDCDTGILPYVLATQTDFYVCAVFTDAAKADAARAVYESANLNASRITAWHQAPGTKLPFPAKFADLVLSERAALGGAMPAGVDDLNRLLKPIRGVALIGNRQEKPAVQAWVADANKIASSGNGWKYLDSNGGGWATRVRPPLENAGGWMQAGGDPGNTMSSHDAALKGPLGVVWYGPPYVKGDTPSPAILANGVLVCPIDGNTVEGWDQYNGRRLWQHVEPGFGGSMAAAVAGGEILYVNQPGKCLRMDLWTGKMLGEVRSPVDGASCTIRATSPDGKILYGVAVKKDAKGAQSSSIFALNAATQKSLWIYDGPGGWTVMSDGRMYLVGGEIKDGPKRQQALDDVRAYLKRTDPKALEGFDKEAPQHDIRLMTVIDAARGKVLYEAPVDITNCGGRWVPGVGYGSKRYVNPMVGGCTMANSGCIIFCTQSDSDKGWPLWPGGGYGIRGIAVYDGATGKLLWKKSCDYRSRPVAMGGVVYAQPWAYDLRTGERKTRTNPVSGEPTPYAWGFPGKQCGILNASENFIFGRNMGVGYHDVLRDQGTYTFMQSRPNCFIDTSSGGGMMIKPPMCLGCICAWSLPFTIAMAQADEEPEIPFSIYSPGDAMPVGNLRLNFGDEGDRRDAAGNLWLMAERQSAKAYPPRMNVEYAPSFVTYPGAPWNQRNVRRSTIHTPIENTDTPFVFATAIRGIRCLILPVTSPAYGTGVYTVRLGFCALPGDKPGQRIFDVRLNGNTVLKDFDILKETGKPDRALWKEFEITLDGDLQIDFISKQAEPTLDQMPLLNGLTLVRKEMTTLGIDAPQNLWINHSHPEKTITLKLANHLGAPFKGKVTAKTDKGIDVTLPNSGAVTLDPGKSIELPIALKGSDAAKTGIHNLAFTVASSGKTIAERSTAVEWLGAIERLEVSGFAVCLIPPSPTWRPLTQNLLGPGLRVSSDTGKKSDESGAYSTLWFDFPARKLGTIRSARLRLTTDPAQRALQAALFGLDGRSPLGSKDWGELKQVKTPPRPDFSKIQYPARPETLPATTRLHPAEWSPNIVEADVPGELIQDNNGNANPYLLIEPTAPNGPVYQSGVLIIDYQPEPKPPAK